MFTLPGDFAKEVRSRGSTSALAVVPSGHESTIVPVAVVITYWAPTVPTGRDRTN